MQRPDLESARPGTKPLLPPEAERHIVEYVIARQKSCRPVTRTDIIRKGREISELVCDKSIGEGWYLRFLARHSELTIRTAQILSKARGSIVDIDISTLFNTVVKATIDNKLDARRTFNMDETAFQTKKTAKKVVVLRGSRDVWKLDPATNFHLSIVACGSADGFNIPSVFILPEQTVKVDLMVGCTIKGAAVTTTPSGFMNMGLFKVWLRHLSTSVPDTVERPLLLVMDGCSSHYFLETLELALELGILIVLLPSNATHLLQPLDVAVFATLKGKLKILLSEIMEDGGDGSCSIDKITAIELVSMAWVRSRLRQNLRAGFAACGLFPLSLVCMQNRLNRFEENGTQDRPMQAPWLQVRQHVEDQVLLLPPDKMPTRKRKTAKVSGRLLTRELLEATAAVPLATSSSKKRKAS